MENEIKKKVIENLIVSQCEKIIENCIWLRDANVSLCDSCQDTFMLTTSKQKCESLISNCVSLNDANVSLCN